MANLSRPMLAALHLLRRGGPQSAARLTTMWALQRRGMAEFDRQSFKWRLTDAGRAALGE